AWCATRASSVAAPRRGSWRNWSACCGRRFSPSCATAAGWRRREQTSWDSSPEPAHITSPGGPALLHLVEPVVQRPEADPQFVACPLLVLGALLQDAQRVFPLDFLHGAGSAARGRCGRRGRRDWGERARPRGGAADVLRQVLRADGAAAGDQRRELHHV